MKEEIKRLIFEALGETSAIFMSQEVKGTEIEMPSEEIKKIGDTLVEKLTDIIKDICMD